MVRVSRKLNAEKCKIAVLRRGNINHPPQVIQNNTRICASCNRSINAKILEIELNEECLRLNVMKQKKHGSCIFRYWLVDFVRLFAECRVNIFIIKNIYVPTSARCCF